MAQQRDISAVGVVLRMIGAVAVVLLTFNPSGHSYYHWALEHPSNFGAPHAFLGALLLAAWVFSVRACLASLGALGVTLSVLVLGTLVWLLADWGVLQPKRPSAIAWIALVALGLILGLGLSWSHLRRRITGQMDVDELPG